MKYFITLSILIVGCFAVHGRSLQQIIKQAIKNKDKTLKIAPGIYRLNKPLIIRNAKDLTIDGTGVKLIYTRPKMHGMRLAMNNNLTLKGFTIDFEPLPFTQGTITAINGKSIDVKLHKGYPELTKEYRAKFAVHVFDPISRDWKARGHNSMAKSYKIISPRLVRIFLRNGADYLVDSKNPVITKGDLISISMRATTGISIYSCNNFTAENMLIHTFPGIAMLGRGGDGVHNIRNIKIVPGPKPAGALQDRLISTCADGINYAGFRGKLIVENCNFSYMGDDSINFYGAPGHILKKINANTIIATVSRAASEHLKIGDSLVFYSRDNLAPLSEAKVTGMKFVTKKRQEICEYITRAGLKAGKNPDCNIMQLILDRPLALKTGQQISFMDFKNSGAIIRNNHFHHHRARGIRLQVNNTLIENNIFENIMHAAITLGPEGMFEEVMPFESSWLKNISIRNNIIRNVGRGYKISENRSSAPGAIATEITKFRKISPTYAGHKNISITNNKIDGCSVSGIFMCAVDGLIISGNQISNTNYAPPVSSYKMPPNHAINCYFSKNISIKNNLMTSPGKYCHGKVLLK